MSAAVSSAPVTNLNATNAPNAAAAAANAAAANVNRPPVAGGAVSGNAVPATPFASASLYVGDLAPDVTEASLFEMFNAVGPCASVRVCRDSATRRSLGYAYVNFHRVEDAERALDTLNYRAIRGRPCRIMWCHRDPSLRKSGVGNIFVNHLDKSIDHKTLFDTFSKFGNILSCKVATNLKGESLGYGFVHFENESDAQQAIQIVDGKRIGTSVVSVQSFKSKKERHGVGQAKGKFTNVFVKNLPSDVTKEQLDVHFQSCGAITSSIISVDKNDKSRAYGFVNFGTPEEATKAVETLHNSDMSGKKIYVGRAQKKEEREKELREKFEAAKAERAKKYQGTNLYVKNLPDEVDDTKLRDTFAKFGSITSARVMKDNSGRSKNFGFVCFSQPEEATKAVTEMNSKMLDGKPLYVAIAQRKDQRRAMLETHFQNRGGKTAGPNVPGGPVPAGPHLAGPNLGGGFIPGQPGVMPLFPGQLPGLQARQFMYPQQLPLMPRFAGAPQPHQLMGIGMNGMPLPGGLRGAPNVPLNYQMLANPPMAAGPTPAGRPLNQRQGRQQHHNQQHQHQPHHQQPNRGPAGPAQVAGIRYNDNVRNAPNRPQQPQHQTANELPQAQNINLGLNEPLALQDLAKVAPDVRKQMIGERLFPLVSSQQPALAGKITGMLLEMEDGELIHLLESQTALAEKITEALNVLHQSEEPSSDK